MTDHRTLTHCRTTGKRLPRRDWLKAAAVTCFGAHAMAAPAVDWRAKAKQNLRLGVDAGVYSKLPLEEAAARIRDDGFRNVLSNYIFADVRFNPLAPDWEAAGKIVDTFERHGIEIAAVFGYVNLIDPIPARLKQGEARLETLLTNWKRLGCRNVSTETGTFNPKSAWLEAPENETEEGYVQCRAALEKWAKVAEKAGAILSIEPYWRNVIGSIDRTDRLLREVGSPALKLVMDPNNYFRKEELPKMQPMLEEMFRRLGSQIVVAHAKDVKPAAEGTELPASGKGVLDYPLYLHPCSRSGGDGHRHPRRNRRNTRQSRHGQGNLPSDSRQRFQPAVVDTIYRPLRTMGMGHVGACARSDRLRLSGWRSEGDSGGRAEVGIPGDVLFLFPTSAVSSQVAGGHRRRGRRDQIW
jgi:sugar phosphate isomerase/epimerase